LVLVVMMNTFLHRHNLALMQAGGRGRRELQL